MNLFSSNRSVRSLSISSSSAMRSEVSLGPPSPTFSDATNASALHFGSQGPDKIITRLNLKSSIQAYDDLINMSAAYRNALISLASVTAGFADAMNTCAGLKGPSYEASTRFQAASGLHHMMSNHWHVLAQTLANDFEAPLRQQLEQYKATVAERSARYERALVDKSRVIRQLEARNMNKKQRNMQSFREALTLLQLQVEELDVLKVQHYQEICDHEEEVWDSVQGGVALTVRSSMEIFEKFTSKSSDPVIEAMLTSVPDPFDSYGLHHSENQIFSILGPLALSESMPLPDQGNFSVSQPGTPKSQYRHEKEPSSDTDTISAPSTPTSPQPTLSRHRRSQTNSSNTRSRNLPTKTLLLVPPDESKPETATSSSPQPLPTTMTLTGTPANGRDWTASWSGHQVHASTPAQSTLFRPPAQVTHIADVTMTI